MRHIYLAVIAAFFSLAFAGSASAQFTGGVSVATGDVNGDGAASAAFSGYLKLPDIDGESVRASDGNSARSVGASETLTVGANQTETIRGGQAVVTGVLWNGKDAPPARNAKGSANITLKRGVLSDSLQRLQLERRIIPAMTLVADGKTGPKTEYKLKNVLISSYQTSSSASGDTHEVEISFQSVSW